MSDVVVYQEPKPLSLVDVRGQVNLIQEIMRGVMKEGVHYGVIPGTGKKPSLLKPGAETLCLTFRLSPSYSIVEQKDGDHLTFLSTCTLTHIPSGRVFGTGMGSCSTKESKYAFRSASRKCPQCGKESIIKGREEFGGGWVCFKKQGGCGAKFEDTAPEITSQESGKVPNDNLADQYNTVLKMSNKRSLVAGVLNALAASDIFTQDIEDIEHAAPQATTRAAPSSPAQPPQPAGSAFLSEDQVMELGKALGECDHDAEKLFLQSAKITKLHELPAADYDEAMAWTARRKARLSKPHAAPRA